MLSQATIDTVKSTVPLLEAHGEAITRHFYQSLFTHQPELKHVFNQVNQQRGEQPRALADAVIAYGRHLDNLPVLLPAVARIAHKHASIGIQPEQYPIVGKHLLASIQTVLDLPEDHPALVAWEEAYGVLADVFIGAEAEIYKDNADASGGWEGFRAFTISDIVEETPDVKSFYLVPADGGAIPHYQGGQYVGLKVNPEASAFDEIRQYSLSGKSGEKHLRITTKAETEGLVSNHLHHCHGGATVLLRAPTGVFTLASHGTHHVFLAGGVGITPMMGMLYEALDKGVAPANILFIHCARTPEQHIFREELPALAKANGFGYKTVVDAGGGVDHQGYLNQDVLGAWLDAQGIPVDTSTHIYCCGPQGFMSGVYQQSKALGYDEANIHYETFGPTETLS